MLLQPPIKWVFISYGYKYPAFGYLPLDKNQFHKLKVNNKFT